MERLSEELKNGPIRQLLALCRSTSSASARDDAGLQQPLGDVLGRLGDLHPGGEGSTRVADRPDASGRASPAGLR
jgi:hypothetical protein